jgi:TIR domain
MAMAIRPQDLVVAGHAFLSYVREDSAQVDRLQRVLQEAGIPMWRDKSDLWPGEDWQAKIREAISGDALAFIACFSASSLARTKSYQNEELILAVEQLRLRQPEQPWLIPVRFDDCEIPDRDLGGGRRLSSLQRVDLFGDSFDDSAARLVAGIRRILGPAGVSQARIGPWGRGDQQAYGITSEAGQVESLALTGIRGQDHTAASGTFTSRWRYTSDGFEATPLMNIVNMAMPGHLGMHDQSPYVRIGVCVACEPLSQETGSSKIGAGFVRFLSRDPAAALTSSLTHADGNVSWVRLAGHGVIRLEATLGDAGQASSPAASAMLLPPVAGIQFHGRPDGVACLWLHVEPRRPDGTIASPVSLAVWNQRLKYAISLASRFAGFLTDDLGLATHDDPAARIAVLLNATSSMTELIDIGPLRVLPDAVTSRQFLGYAIADRTGMPASDIALTTLAQLCEYTLHLDDFEPALAAL